MKDYLTVTQAAKKFPFSESALRNLIQRSDENGFDNVVKRVGRKVLIDSDALVGWIESQGGQDA